LGVGVSVGLTILLVLAYLGRRGSRGLKLVETDGMEPVVDGLTIEGAGLMVSEREHTEVL
jgi:hypothetical protein